MTAVAHERMMFLLQEVDVLLQEVDELCARPLLWCAMRTP